MRHTEENVTMNELHGMLHEARALATARKLRIKTLANVLLGLKNSECWCDVGIGNPMLSGHTSQCKAARAALEGLE